MTEKNYSEEEIKKRLTEQMVQHRDEKLKLTQKEAADLLYTSEKTYQRWESSGKGLSDFFVIQNIFRTLHFSTSEIINVLGLPPLTLNEVKELYQDKETLKSLQENSIYSFVRQKCDKWEDITIEKLFFVLLKEYFKRKGYKWGD